MGKLGASPNDGSRRNPERGQSSLPVGKLFASKSSLNNSSCSGSKSDSHLFGSSDPSITTQTARQEKQRKDVRGETTDIVCSHQLWAEFQTKARAQGVTTNIGVRAVLLKFLEEKRYREQLLQLDEDQSYEEMAVDEDGGIPLETLPSRSSSLSLAQSFSSSYTTETLFCRNRRRMNLQQQQATATEATPSPEEEAARRRSFVEKKHMSIKSTQPIMNRYRPDMVDLRSTTTAASCNRKLPSKRSLLPGLASSINDSFAATRDALVGGFVSWNGLDEDEEEEVVLNKSGLDVARLRQNLGGRNNAA